MEENIHITEVKTMPNIEEQANGSEQAHVDAGTQNVSSEGTGVEDEKKDLPDDEDKDTAL